MENMYKAKRHRDRYDIQILGFWVVTLRSLSGGYHEDGGSMSVYTYKITPCHNPENQNLYHHRGENFKTFIDCVSSAVKLSLYRPWRPLGLWEVEAPTFSDIRLTDGGKFISPTFWPPLFPGNFLVFISVRDWVDPRAIVRLEKLGKLKNPPYSGLEPVCISSINVYLCQKRSAQDL
jgi:hypothetical protein